MARRKAQTSGRRTVWASPVLYLGIMLVVMVVGLLLAPFVIDWNGYRADLEAYGRKLTGRSVTIDGPVSVRLFPWPRLTVEDIRVAGPRGPDDRDFADADRITIHMTLQGLLQGGIDVESIDIAAPVVNFERQETGEGNWVLSPSADLIGSDILSRVKLDKITLSGGTLNYHDQRRGEMVTLDDINADVASPGVAGPWRLRARAVYEDRPVSVALNTAAFVRGQPFLFGVKFQSADNSGTVYSFDGAYKDGFAEGDVLVAPAQGEDGKGDAEGQIRPLVVRAHAKGNLDQVDFTDLQIAHDEPADASAIATGSATLRLGRHIDAKLDLSASMLDLDELAGAKSRDVLRQAGSLAVIDSLLALLPRDMSLAGTAQVTALKSEGQSFDNVSLSLAAERDRLRIERLSSGLPGRSEMLFKGNYFSAPGGGELSGEFGLESNDLRALALWLWPAARDRLAPMWTGSRGRLKMQTGLSLTPSGLRLTDTDFELDGEAGKGALAITSAGRGAVDLALESRRFDLDAYAPQGVPALQAAAAQGPGGILSVVLPRPDAPDLRLKVKAGELLMNAVTARDVVIDLQSGANGLDLRALNIGAVGGARLEASGLILDNGKGADGSISLDVAADDPGELIRLTGIAGTGELPPWARNLGKTALTADLAVKPGNDGQQTTLRASGSTGELAFSASGSAGSDDALTASARVTAPTSARILSLLSLSPVTQDVMPGSLALDAQGSMAAGFTTTATVQALGGRLDYQGRFSPLAEGFGLGGTLALRATEAGPLLAATGLPVGSTAGGVLVADARLGWRDGKLTLTGLEGRLGTAGFSGDASLTPARVLDASLNTGALELSDLMAGAFLDWSGPIAGLETGFAKALPFGLTGTLKLSPSEIAIAPELTARQVSVTVAAKPGEIRLALRGTDAGGKPAELELTSAGSDDSRSLAGRLSLPVDLARQLALAGGGQIATGTGQIDLTLSSEGRSPAAALAAAQGQGRFALDDFRLLGLTPSAFTAALASAKDAVGINAAFAAMRGGEGMEFGAVQADITVTGGEMSFAPVRRSDGDADVEVKAVADLSQGALDIETSLTLKARPGLPPMNVAYAGPPQALVRSESNSEIATALGVTIMQEGLNELERLQQEQARLAQEEAKQRAEDEARLQAYYAQRDELLLRRREIKVQAEMQVMEADRLRRQIEAARAANAEINKTELRQRLRELRTWKRLAELSEAPAVPPAAVAKPQPAPAVPRKPATVKPVILAKPPGAPVVISPEPNFSPSQ